MTNEELAAKYGITVQEIEALVRIAQQCNLPLEQVLEQGVAASLAARRMTEQLNRDVSQFASLLEKRQPGAKESSPHTWRRNAQKFIKRMEQMEGRELSTEAKRAVYAGREQARKADRSQWPRWGGAPANLGKNP